MQKKMISLFTILTILLFCLGPTCQSEKPQTVQVHRCYNHEVKDHLYTIHPSCENAKDYKYQGNFFNLLAEGTPSAIPFYRCYNSIVQDHWHTTHGNCENDSASQREGILGYIYPPATPVRGTIALERYYFLEGNEADHLYLVTPIGDGHVRYEYEFSPGYVVPVNPVE